MQKVTDNVVEISNLYNRLCGKCNGFVVMSLSVLETKEDITQKDISKFLEYQ